MNIRSTLNVYNHSMKESRVNLVIIARHAWKCSIGWLCTYCVVIRRKAEFWAHNSDTIRNLKYIQIILERVQIT